jgi:hypothetical protein
MAEDYDPGTLAPVGEFTFFVDADLYAMNGGELAASEDDLHQAGIERVDIPTEYGADLGERIPVRVRGTAKGIRVYARLLGVVDPLQLEEMERVLAAAEAREQEAGRESSDGYSS